MKSKTAGCMLSRSVVNQSADIGAVMLHIDIHPQVFVISRQGVEAMRAGGDDLLDTVCLDQLDVLGGHRLVEVFVAQLPRRLAAAFFLFAEDADTDSGGIADPDEVPGNFTVPLVKRSETADEVENVHVTVLLHDLHLEPICPVAPDSIAQGQRDCRSPRHR